MGSKDLYPWNHLSGLLCIILKEEQFVWRNKSRCPHWWRTPEAELEFSMAGFRWEFYKHPSSETWFCKSVITGRKMGEPLTSRVCWGPLPTRKVPWWRTQEPHLSGGFLACNGRSFVPPMCPCHGYLLVTAEWKAMVLPNSRQHPSEPWTSKPL